jgi:hypothetical protein
VYHPPSSVENDRGELELLHWGTRTELARTLLPEPLRDAA